MLRDISAEGAGFEGDVPLTAGEQVSVTWGTFQLSKAKVIWAIGNRFGLSLDVQKLQSECKLLYRSVRVPVGLPATVFLGGHREDGELINISQAGALVSYSGEAECGALASICCGEFVFPNSVLRWKANGVAGFRLEKAFPLRHIGSMLAKSSSSNQAIAA